MIRLVAAFAAAAYALCAAAPSQAAGPVEYSSVKAAMWHLWGSDPTRFDQIDIRKADIVAYHQHAPDALDPAAGPVTCDEPAGCYAFNTCNFPVTLLPPKYKHTKLDAYARIASTVITYRYVLQELGYPSWVAASRLNTYESQAVREVTSGKPNIGDSPSLAAAIRRDMRAYTQTGKSLRGFIWTAGCGAGEFTLTLMPQPSTARIFIIPSFFYELCRAQRINPNDVDSCEHWREVLGNKIDDAAGEYHYFVRWSDGAVRRGVINADDFYKLAAFGKPLRLFRP